MYLVGVSCIWSGCHVFGQCVMYFVGVSCILSGCHVFCRGVMYLVQYQLFSHFLSYRINLSYCIKSALTGLIA